MNAGLTEFCGTPKFMDLESQRRTGRRLDPALQGVSRVQFICGSQATEFRQILTLCCGALQVPDAANGANHAWRETVKSRAVDG